MLINSFILVTCDISIEIEMSHVNQCQLTCFKQFQFYLIFQLLVHSSHTKIRSLFCKLHTSLFKSQLRHAHNHNHYGLVHYIWHTTFKTKKKQDLYLLKRVNYIFCPVANRFGQNQSFRSFSPNYFENVFEDCLIIMYLLLL